ncbi:uncharacterized protein LOC123315282 isoform X1 [Coccinella septempunctata]|uniref:uncharacterized protein LOC123315282 isoform X1 n=1 Tax=Coccinella septempunctata TaxID=41139 RepID=UPI001D076359|nr:uncharacterized protein LOC123315282 isoform X1 [Coccinella septempunctata]
METQKTKKSSTERVRAFRDRQRASKPPKKPPKSSQQRSRKYRARHRARKLFLTWDNRQIVMFLTIFESFESLWDINNAEYDMMRNNDEMHEKFLKDLMLIGLMGENADLDQLKALIEIIKETYAEEMKSMQSNNVHVKKYADNYEPKLPWFEHATFLRNSIEAKQQSPINASQIIQDPPEMKIEIDEESEHLEVPEFVACTDSLEAAVKSEPIIDEDQSMHDLKSVAGYNTAREAQEDACNFFGKYVAAELRSLPIKARMEVQQEIQSCITAAVIRNSTGSKATETAQVPNTSAGPSST